MNIKKVEKKLNSATCTDVINHLRNKNGWISDRFPQSVATTLLLEFPKGKEFDLTLISGSKEFNGFHYEHHYILEWENGRKIFSYEQ